MVEKAIREEGENRGSLLDKDSPSLKDDRSKTVDPSPGQKERDSAEGKKDGDHSLEKENKVYAENQDNRSEIKAENVREEWGDGFQKKMDFFDREAGGKFDKYGKKKTVYSQDKSYIRKRFVFRKKECYFTKNKINYIDYKDVELLKRFIGRNGRILPRRFTGTSPLFQRKLSIAIKRARVISLLPYVGEIEYSRTFSPPSEMDRPRRKEISHGEKV